MILVDSSVWIDYFSGITTPETDRLEEMLGTEPVAVGDLILVEVLQGFRHDNDFPDYKDPSAKHKKPVIPAGMPESRPWTVT